MRTNAIQPLTYHSLPYGRDTSCRDFSFFRLDTRHPGPLLHHRYRNGLPEGALAVSFPPGARSSYKYPS